MSVDRPHRGAQFRPEDRRRHAGRNAGQSAGARGLSRHRGGGVRSAMLDIVRPRHRLRQDRSAEGRIAAASRAGRITCLLGPNGAGKTTLMMTIAGILQAAPRLDPARRRPSSSASRRPSIVAQRRRAGAGEPAGVSADERAREPARRRLSAQRQGRDRRRHRAHVCALSAPAASGASSLPARCPAASSRCWRSRAR